MQVENPLQQLVLIVVLAGYLTCIRIDKGVDAITLRRSRPEIPGGCRSCFPCGLLDFVAGTRRLQAFDDLVDRQTFGPGSDICRAGRRQTVQFIPEHDYRPSQPDNADDKSESHPKPQMYLE